MSIVSSFASLSPAQRQEIQRGALAASEKTPYANVLAKAIRGEPLTDEEQEKLTEGERKHKKTPLEILLEKLRNGEGLSQSELNILRSGGYGAEVDLIERKWRRRPGGEGVEGVGGTGDEVGDI